AGQTRDDRDALAAYWREQVFPAARAAGLASAVTTFEAFLDQAIHDGYFEMPVAGAAPRRFLKGGLLKRGAAAAPRAKDTFELVLYPKVGLGDGSDALNPWLQELPDPVTKAVWDNYACLSPRTAKRLGVELGDVVRVSGKTPDGKAASIELPALVQAGQHDDAVAIALGYGRKGTERFTTIGPRWLEARPTTPEGEPVGVGASSLRWLHEGNVADTGLSVSVERTGGRSELALTQDHHSLFVPEHLAPKGGEKRPHVQETTLSAYRKDPASGGHAGHEPITLWKDDFKTDGPKWGMAVDLNVCTGCSGCSVACQAENNIPVVGKDEVRRHREMTWMRIDRYYADIGDDGDVDVVHQPMMCQHCGNAPCETVCPVLATVHSEDGLNQQVYNRCVGTRYCANNCPYKVRRFNWFDYPHGGEVQRLVLNPDVTIRSRGVMEKCSMCIQRIQEGKIQAKVEGRPLMDGDIQPACVQSCPADALVFGDLNDPESRVSKAVRSPRAYTVLQELNVKSSVHYMTKVRHRDGKGTHHG
ncbi:MAG: 4Fe-4S dicluster domain-containing protein, partial [Planctomycetota bacterium]